MASTKQGHEDAIIQTACARWRRHIQHKPFIRKGRGGHEQGHHEEAGRPTRESKGHFLTMPCLSWHLHRPQNVCAKEHISYASEPDQSAVSPCSCAMKSAQRCWVSGTRLLSLCARVLKANTCRNLGEIATDGTSTFTALPSRRPRWDEPWHLRKGRLAR
jgi:hypothetical protein